MSNLYQRLCQTGELVPAGRGDHISSVRIPSDEVHGNSPYTSTVKERARGTPSEGFNSKTWKPKTCRGILGSSVAWSDENYNEVSPDSKAGVTSTGAHPSAVDDDSLLSGSLARYNGDFACVSNADGCSSDDCSEGSEFSESISELERRSSMLNVDDDLPEYAEDTRAFDACIPTNLNLMDSMSFDVASHVTFYEETSLDAKPTMDDEAFQGELWLDIDAKGRGSRSPPSSKRNKYSKYRGMQTSAVTNSSPKEPRIRAWHTVNESDFLFSANSTASQSVGIGNTASNYLEMTKKVDERILAMLSGDQNAMVALHQKLDHLKTSTKSSSSVPSEPSTLPLEKASQMGTFPVLTVNPAAV